MSKEKELRKEVDKMTELRQHIGIGGYVLKKWFDEPKDMVEALRKRRITFVNHDANNMVFVWKDCVIYLHCSVGHGLRASTKIKVYAWKPFCQPFESRGDYFNWEDELGTEIEKLFS